MTENVFQKLIPQVYPQVILMNITWIDQFYSVYGYGITKLAYYLAFISTDINLRFYSMPIQTS